MDASVSGPVGWAIYRKKKEKKEYKTKFILKQTNNKAAHNYRGYIGGYQRRLGRGRSRVGEMDEKHPKIQTFIYKINAIGCNVHHGDNS